jgi:alkylhydroperoxidase/carboxymuconolactone decarboxylase family protein YurZ
MKRKPTPLTDEYIRAGQWNPLWDQMRSLDPGFMEAYLNFREAPQRNGPLPRHFKELILVAINAATTHLYAPGVRRHIANALSAGATREEVLETIQITTVMGIHSCNLAIPILCEEWERFEREKQPASGQSSSPGKSSGKSLSPGQGKPSSTGKPSSPRKSTAPARQPKARRAKAK